MPTLFLIRVHNATVKWHQAQQASNQHPAHNGLWNLVCVCSVTWAIGVIPCQFDSLPCSKTFRCKKHLTGKINEPITAHPPPFLPRVIKRRTWEFKIQLRTYIFTLYFLELYFLPETFEVYIQPMNFVFCCSDSEKSTFWLIELPYLFPPCFSHV